MSHFFQATSKVQKDRHIMRETDSRLAKYSRRGLIFNFIAFLICLVGGRFVSENRELTVVLTAGLLLVTFLRGFYLFRFDQLYPRGPARWRNAYFVVTLMGAMWWGVIMASITIVLGMKDETPLLWLYTVVFFSTTAHAFAPYHRFLSYYQFFGIIPAAAAAISLGTPAAYTYGALMLMFYLILSHQCRLISDNYWEKLEAGYALGKRATAEDKEKSDSRASLQLSKEFMVNLQREMSSMVDIDVDGPVAVDDRSILTTKLKVLEDNISIFKGVVTRKLEIKNRVFNIRHEIQYLVSEFVDQAELRGLQIETSLSPNLPMRIKGDSIRFAQVIRTLLSEIVSSSKSAAVILEVQFLREYEAAGELLVTARRVQNKASAMAFFTETIKESDPTSLSLTVAKGLAELMDGEIEVIATADEDYQIRFSARLDVADQGGQLDFHKGRFEGTNILLVGSNPAVIDIKRQELEALGFSITTETHFKRLLTLIQTQIKNGFGVENILIYYEPQNADCLSALKDLREAEELKTVNKIIAATESCQQYLAKSGCDESLGFYFVAKPLGLFELESTFEFIYTSKGDDEAVGKCGKGTIIVLGDKGDVADLVSDCHILPNQRVIATQEQGLWSLLAEFKDSMLLIPCDTHSDTSELLDKVRLFESKASEDQAYIPIIGVGKECSQSEVEAFESGFDDYIDLASERSKTLSSMLRYWRSLPT